MYIRILVYMHRIMGMRLVLRCGQSNCYNYGGTWFEPALAKI